MAPTYTFIFACVSLAVLVILTQKIQLTECRLLKLGMKNDHEYRNAVFQISGRLLLGENADRTYHPLDQSLPKPPSIRDGDDQSSAPPSNQPDYFRPTTPGHSPGIGHSFSQPSDGATKEKFSPDDFGLTTRSHSIGKERSLDQSLLTPASLNPEDDESPSNQPDYFRPTTPGHSPGIGHSFAPSDVVVSEENSSPDHFRLKTPSQSPSIKHSSDQSPPSLHPEDAESPGNQPDYFRRTTPGNSPGIGHSFSTPIDGAAIKENSSPDVT